MNGNLHDFLPKQWIVPLASEPTEHAWEATDAIEYIDAVSLSSSIVGGLRRTVEHHQAQFLEQLRAVSELARQVSGGQNPGRLPRAHRFDRGQERGHPVHVALADYKRIGHLARAPDRSICLGGGTGVQREKYTFLFKSSNRGAEERKTRRVGVHYGTLVRIPKCKVREIRAEYWLSHCMLGL